MNRYKLTLTGGGLLSNIGQTSKELSRDLCNRPTGESGNSGNAIPYGYLDAYLD